MLTQEDVFLIGMYQEQEETPPRDLLDKFREFMYELNKKLAVPIFRVYINVNAEPSKQVEMMVVDDENYYASIEQFLEGNVGIPTNVNNQVLLAYTLIPLFGIILSWIGWHIRLHEWIFAVSASILYVAGLIDGLIDYDGKKFAKFKFGTNIIFFIVGAILTLVLFIFKSSGFEVK